MNSLPHRHNLTSVYSNICETGPISLFWAPNGLNELMEMFQIFRQPNWQIKNHGMFYSPIMVILKYTTSVEAQNKDFPPVLQMDFSMSLVPHSVQQANL